MTSCGDLETVLFRKFCIVSVSTRLIERIKTFFVVNITDSLEEEKWENVSLKVGGIHWAAKNIRSIPEPRFD
jgi:hypothetical protein